MSQRSLEIVAATVEEAVEQGLRKLGVSAAQVIVEVLEEPSSGLFGVGARPAKVRLNTLVEDTLPPTKISSDVDAAEGFADDHYIPDDFYQEKSDTAPELAEHAEHAEHVEHDDGYAEQEEEKALEIIAPNLDESEWDDELRAAQTVMGELLAQMRLRASLHIGRAGEEEDAPWLLSLEGRGAGKLVGRRGEALAALQFLARLIVSQRIGRRCFFVLDADGYKLRRTDRLRALAERMANQAVLQRRTMTLEPLPPNERRIVHIALRGREDVETISVGEGDGRKVTIAPR